MFYVVAGLLQSLVALSLIFESSSVDRGSWQEILYKLKGLFDRISNMRREELNGLLFRIVSRMSNESREEAAADFVNKFHNYPINVCVHELIIEDEIPNQLHQFASTMFEDIARRINPKKIVIEVLKIFI